MSVQIQRMSLNAGGELIIIATFNVDADVVDALAETLEHQLTTPPDEIETTGHPPLEPGEELL